MAQPITLTVEPRERAGKGAARKTRRGGRVPGVVYGNKETPTLISIDPKALMLQADRAGFFNHIFELDMAGNKLRVLPRDIQFDPVTDKPIHVDFMRFGPDTKLSVDVPVVPINQEKSPGLKKGGVLNLVSHTIRLICAPDNIPENITVDLADLEIGHSIHIGQIKLPEGVKPAISRTDFTLATIVAPSIYVEAEVVAPVAEGAEGAPAEGAEGTAAPGAEGAPAEGAAPAEGGAPAKGGAAPAKGAAPAGKGAAAAPAKGGAPAKSGAPAAKGGGGKGKG